jgi:enoyl-CoA hydratase/carnithine racemase
VGLTVTSSELGSARVVTWDRQANRNAWTRETIEAIAAGIEDAGEDESVRCVIARGAGEHFSAGDDLFAAIEATPESWAATVAAFQRVTSAALASPVPVIAAIDGVCIGGALEFAASCDLRIATDRARFGTPEVGIGLTYTNAGSHFLPSTMGETAARELLLSGALRDADWAQRHRFVNDVVDPADLDGVLVGWIQTFDGVSRAAVARTKAMLNARFGDLLPAAMEREEVACVELFEGPDAPGLLRAFAERRR